MNNKARKAIAAIEAHGALLVFPINNKKEPRSIWSELYPRTKMRWEWDEDGDQKLSDLWRLREELSRSDKVVYAKWYQGRATFLAMDVFTSLLRFLDAERRATQLGHESREILDSLLADSPLSTKQLKAAVSLEGRSLEPMYNRAMKPLWQNLLIVAYGEFDDSSFPSLGIGATQTLFEELWLKSQQLNFDEAQNLLLERLGSGNLFYRWAERVRRAGF